MNVWLVSGGDQLEQISRSLVTPPDYVIAADSGLLLAQAHGIKVDLLVGDFDSVPQSALDSAERAGVKTLRFEPDKDATDLELAFQEAVKLNPDRIAMVGGHGGRVDHFLGNIGCLARVARENPGIQVVAQLGTAVVHAVTVARPVQFSGQPGELVSLIPWGGDATGVIARGFRWELRGETLPLGSSRGISNELASGEAQVSVKSGVLLVVREKDDRLMR